MGATKRTSFKPGQSGNPAGRAPGSRNRASLAVDALLDGEADTLTRAVVEAAKNGDMVAARMCMDRIAPVRRDRFIAFDLPPIEKADDAVKAATALLAAVAAGELTPSEAADLGKLVDNVTRAIETTDLATRLSKIEEGMKR